MYPLFLKIGSWELSSFGLIAAIGFLLMSFVVWRNAKNFGFEDDKILDNIIVVTSLSMLGARLGYVLYHLDIFLPNTLRILVIWRFPGLSYLGAFIAAVVVMYLYTRRQKLNVLKMAVSYCKSVGVLLIFGSLAVFLDGTVVGKLAEGWILAMPSVGEVGLRHPVGLYGIVLGIIIQVILIMCDKFLFTKKQSKEVLFVWLSVLCSGLFFFVLAFVRDDLLYLGRFSLEMMTSVVAIVIASIALFISSGVAARLWNTSTQALQSIKKKENNL